MVQTASKLYEGGKKYFNFFVNLQDYIGDVQPNRQDKQLCSEFGLNRRPALEKLKQKTVELHYENVGPSFYRGGGSYVIVASILTMLILICFLKVPHGSTVLNCECSTLQSFIREF